MKQSKNKRGETRFYPSFAEVEEMADDSTGACIACGETGQGAEPDAERYTCDSCGKKLVFGSSWFALRGNIRD